MRAAAIQALVAALPLTVQAQSEVILAEYRVKANFLFRFLPYVEWPSTSFDGAGSPLVVGVLGADALADELETIVKSRLVSDRPVVTQRWRRGEALTPLHVLFVGRGHMGALQEVAASKGPALLTVTEAVDGLTHGGIINFVIVDDRVRFDVALKSAEAARLSISSRLLQLARRVVQSST